MSVNENVKCAIEKFVSVQEKLSRTTFYYRLGKTNGIMLKPTTHDSFDIAKQFFEEERAEELGQWHGIVGPIPTSWGVVYLDPENKDEILKKYPDPEDLSRFLSHAAD